MQVHSQLENKKIKNWISDCPSSNLVSMQVTPPKNECLRSLTGYLRHHREYKIMIHVTMKKLKWRKNRTCWICCCNILACKSIHSAGETRNLSRKNRMLSQASNISAKKDMSDNQGLVDFDIRWVSSVLTNEIFGEFKLQRNCYQSWSLKLSLGKLHLKWLLG